MANRVTSVRDTLAVRLSIAKRFLLNPRRGHPKRIPWAWYEKFVKEMEALGSRHTIIGNIIYRSFFGRITKKEVPLCGLKPGDRVIQIGVGSLPQTVLYLAELGAEVEALDNDARAVANASRYLSRFNRNGRILLRQADGLKVDCSAADAVWLSFVVQPKEGILKGAFASLKEGGRLVYRNPVGLFARILPEPVVDPKTIAPCCAVRKVRYFPAMETVVITKTVEKTGTS